MLVRALCRRHQKFQESKAPFRVKASRRRGRFSCKRVALQLFTCRVQRLRSEVAGKRFKAPPERRENYWKLFRVCLSLCRASTEGVISKRNSEFCSFDVTRMGNVRSSLGKRCFRHISVLRFLIILLKIFLLIIWILVMQCNNKVPFLEDTSNTGGFNFFDVAYVISYKIGVWTEREPLMSTSSDLVSEPQLLVHRSKYISKTVYF